MKRFTALAVLCLLSFQAGASEVSQKNIAERLEKSFTAAQRLEIEKLITDSQILVLRSQKELERARITGPHSMPADPGQYPFMAALLVEDSFGNRFQFCGGSLLGKRKILTAAHCNIYVPRAVRVMLNEINVAQGAGRAVKIERFTSHPDYVSAEQGSDVAVITLAEDIEGIQPVVLAPPDPPDEDGAAFAKIMGWGATREGGDTSDVLLHANTAFVSNRTCKVAYPTLKPTMICAGQKEVPAGQDATDTCQGDSGGPIFLIGPQRALTQVGIVSYGYGCGRAGFYGVYTRAASFRDWILAQ